MNEPSEWLKVMLGEIERKRAEESEAQKEAERRGQSAPQDSDKNNPDSTADQDRLSPRSA